MSQPSDEQLTIVISADSISISEGSGSLALTKSAVTSMAGACELVNQFLTNLAKSYSWNDSDDITVRDRILVSVGRLGLTDIALSVKKEGKPVETTVAVESGKPIK